MSVNLLELFYSSYFLHVHLYTFQLCLYVILGWGILSTSLVVCENDLIRTRSNIIGFARFVLVQPTDKPCSFNLVDVWYGVSTIVANCTVHQHAAGSITLNMKEVLSDPVNT